MGRLIRGLHIRNFRNFRDAALHLHPLTILTGHNGAGKSTVQDALAYLATGACRGTAIDGKGAADIVMRQGARDMLVEADVEGIGSIARGIAERTISRGPRRGDTEAEPVLERAEQLLDRLGCTRRIFDLAVRPDAFASLHARDQAAALLELSGIAPFGLDEVLAAGAPEMARSYADTFPTPGEADAGACLAAYMDVQKQAEADRRAARKTLDEARGAYDVARGEAEARPHDEGAHHRTAQLRDKLHAEKADLRQGDDRERAEHEGARRELLRQKADAGKRLSTARESQAQTGNMVDLQEKRRAIETALAAAQMVAGDRSVIELANERAQLGPCSEPAERIASLIAQAEAEQAQAVARIPQIEAEIAKHSQVREPAGAGNDRLELTALRDLQELTERGETRCPTCRGAIDADAITRAIAELEARCEAQAEAVAAWTEAQQALTRLGNELARLTPVAAGECVDALRARLADAVRAADLQSQIEAAEGAQRLERQLRQLDREIAQAASSPDVAAEVEAAEAEVDAIQERIDELGTWVSTRADRIATVSEDLLAAEAELRAHEAAEAVQQALLVRQRAFTTAAEAHEGLDALVMALQGTVRQRMFGAALGRLNSRLADAMGLIGAIADGDGWRQVYGARVRMDERGWLDLRLVRDPEASEPLEIPFGCCSESERLRLTWALQCLAAVNARIVVLDAPESLDARFKFAPYDLGEHLARAGVQAIVCALAPPDGLDLWATVELVDGAVVGEAAALVPEMEVVA